MGPTWAGGEIYRFFFKYRKVSTLLNWLNKVMSWRRQVLKIKVLHRTPVIMPKSIRFKSFILSSLYQDDVLLFITIRWFERRYHFSCALPTFLFGLWSLFYLILRTDSYLSWFFYETALLLVFLDSAHDESYRKNGHDMKAAGLFLCNPELSINASQAEISQPMVRCGLKRVASFFLLIRIWSYYS